VSNDVPNIEFYPLARVEAKEAAAWYDHRSLRASVAFERALSEAIDQAANYPGRWPRCLHGTRYVRLRRFPYVLVYLQREDVQFVVAVAHLHRRPGYWKKRLPKQGR
jgi:plasmid stabilization system protein ParE